MGSNWIRKRETAVFVSDLEELLAAGMSQNPNIWNPQLGFEFSASLQWKCNLSPIFKWVQKSLLLWTQASIYRCTSAEGAWAMPLFCTMSSFTITHYLMTEYWLGLMLAGKTLRFEGELIHHGAIVCRKAKSHDERITEVLRSSQRRCHHDCYVKLEWMSASGELG